MRSPEIPANERERLQTLVALRILDTDAEERFDRITRLARGVFGVPFALVNLIADDRQWTKSQNGTQIVNLPREQSFCAHAVCEDATLVVPDLTEDERFADNPLTRSAPRMRFYAGRPLRAENGCALGTLCILDVQPREMSERELAMLDDLAVMVEHELATVQSATIDELTGITNRRGFSILARHVYRVCQLNGLPACLIYFDLRQFKQINDRYGHAAGDRALRRFADLMRETFRESDVFARLGGDEFVLFAGNTRLRDAERMVARLAQTVETHNGLSEPAERLLFNHGIESVPTDINADADDTLESVLASADKRMYEQKRASGT
ncbi:sensor domain-containing diguanylate cyclase [Salinisphaera sp. T31B1]|uniref:sensor domain-containing diguanylate cyclase n=1 Tax=Salinisphaera sp. T31B1 TaxID=727963 RepID=UPI003342BB11